MTTTMAMTMKTKMSKEQNKPTRRHIWLPIIAGILHLHVFYRAASFLFASRSGLPYLEIEPSMALYRTMELSVVLAYFFDLFCCALSVIPYSRCKKSPEIVAHHLPVVFILLPLGIPMWARWTSIEPMLSLLPSLDAKETDFAISLLFRGNGWGFVSSLNEAIMCFQRAELSLNGLSGMENLNEKRMSKFRFWTSWHIELIELFYKLMIFCCFSVLSIWATCHIDIFNYGLYHQENPTEHIISLLVKTYMSPLQMRSVIWRLFIIILYPQMAKRTFLKLRRFLEETRPKKVVKIY